MSRLGKRTREAREGVDREKLYPLSEAVKMVKERAKAKFDETIEVAMNWHPSTSRRSDGPRRRQPAEWVRTFGACRGVRSRRQGR